VQKFTDAAVAKVTEDGDYKGPADFGTKVHKEIANAIKEKDNPNFQAEKSAIKSALEGNSGESTPTRTTRRKTTARTRRATASLAQSGLMPMRTSLTNRLSVFTIRRPAVAA
jgi:hypothetical protein